MKYVIILILTFSPLIYANECSLLLKSNDGTPALYNQEKCMAQNAFKNKNYTKSSMHFENALAIKFFEAPNYTLRLELAESLCLSGNAKRGLNVLKSFVLMAKTDLGEIKCPDDAVYDPTLEHMHLACIGYGSSLSKNKKEKTKKKLERVKVIEAICKNA